MIKIEGFIIEIPFSKRSWIIDGGFFFKNEEEILIFKKRLEYLFYTYLNKKHMLEVHTFEEIEYHNI